MATRKRALGRGLDSLIPQDIQKELDPEQNLSRHDSGVRELLVDEVRPNREQPRSTIKNDKLEELAVSIKRHGVLQPIVVAPNKGKEGGYIIIAGERRWHAAKMAGLKTIPAIVRSLNDQSRLEIALIENIQREDLTPLELAVAYSKLNREFNLTYKQIAMRVGKAATTIINIVRLLILPPAAKRALQRGRISEGHARQIAALDGNPKKQQELLDLILRYHWTVRRAEQFVLGVKEGKDKAQAVQKTKAVTEETKLVAKRLKTEVTLQRLAKGGRLVIRYKDEDDLKRIVKMIT